MGVDNSLLDSEDEGGKARVPCADVRFESNTHSNYPLVSRTEGVDIL